MPKTIAGADAAFSINVLAMIIISPIAWQHVFPLLALPFGLLFVHYQTLPSAFSRRALLLSFILVSLPDFEIGRYLMDYYSPYQMPWYASLIFMVPTLCILLLWAFMIRYGDQMTAATSAIKLPAEVAPVNKS